jgi:enamine deaminase RidA (YjgF/YER057c/UK114 family)
LPAIYQRLEELGLALPPPFVFPSSNRTGCVLSGSVLYLSGHGNGLPKWPGVIERGKVGKDLTLEEAYTTARAVAMVMLSSIHHGLGSLDRVTRVIRLMGMFNSAPGFVQQTQAMDGASDLFCALWGPEHGQHARTAVGVAELPFNLAVEIQGEFEVAPE